MQGRGGQQQLLPRRQQGTVGGEDDLEAQGPGMGQKGPQLRVQQRLPHQVEIQVVRMRAEFGRQDFEFLQGHEALLPPGSGAEGAGQVADVGDFQIGFFQHNCSL